MQNQIKVSVIVPIYNVGSYLEQCIKSILSQTHNNLELVLVDDGSPDNSGDICDYFASIDQRVKVIHQVNSGVSAARNTGIDNSTGDYICFVDGDDYVCEDYIEYLLDLIVKENSDISLSTQMFSNFNQKQIDNQTIEHWTNEQATEKILCYRVPIGVYCKMFKRSFLGNRIRFNTNLFIGEGYNFNTFAFQRANRVIAGNRKIYFYRRDNPVSATTKFSEKKWINGIYAIDVIKNNFIISSPSIDRAWEYAYWRTHSDVYDIMVLSKAERDYPELFSKSLSVTRKNALIALKVPVSRNDRVRAILMFVYPKLIPMLMKLRRKVYKSEV